MDTFQPAEAPRFRAALEARALQLRDILSHEVDATRMDSPREVSGFADDAGRIADSQLDGTQAALAAAELADVNAALRRIEDGTYGTCIDCGDDIDVRRLLAVPAAAHCTACQALHEKH